MSGKKPKPAASDGVRGKRRAPAHVPAGGSRAFHGYDDALAFLESRVNVEALSPTQVDGAATFRLDRMRALMDRLENPQSSFKCVHVAGSKGKGSVCEMLASCLQACGIATGLYTSPHLVDMSERIRICRDPIGRGAFSTLLARAADAADAIARAHGDATYFELLTATAFLHFAEQAVDVAVIEVGLGGRDDATNIITPEACGITAIHVEHARLLGPAIEDIARHKAGIIKPGIPAVSVPQSAPVAGVLRARAAEVGTTLEFLGEDIDYSFRFESSPELGPHTRVVVTTPRSSFEHLPVPLKGEHQAVNCALALALIDKLRTRGVEAPEAAVAQGLSATPSLGRLETVRMRPRVVVDGAHTPESVQALIKALGAQVRYDSLVVVFGCASDKDAGGMLAALATGADKVIFTRAHGNARAADPRDLQRRFSEVSGKMSQLAPNVREALALAARAVNRDDLVLVTGSFAVAGEAKRHAQASAPSPGVPDGALREVKLSGVARGRDARGKPGERL
ncbi:MAG: cyanophycin synthetase [Planctomycetota bacterium]|nr:cyanophycin synthetase [Planctomycetota bacterium]